MQIQSQEGYIKKNTRQYPRFETFLYSDDEFYISKI